MEQDAPVFTRSGRTVKAPHRYIPVETPLDDISEPETDDVEGSEAESQPDECRIKKRRRCDHHDDSEEESADDSDTGSDLKGFVVSDDEDDTERSDEEESEELFDSDVDSDEAE